MLDLNDLRMFDRVAGLHGFAAAARELGVPKSTISRGVARLEASLGVRLLQRTTRQVSLTASGEALHRSSRDLLRAIEDAAGYVGNLAAVPKGTLRISSGIGFGINVLSDILPGFLEEYPDLRISLDLSSANRDLVADTIDVAVRLGPLKDSTMVATRLGSMKRCLCAAPAYLDRRGTPHAPAELHGHDLIEMPGQGGRPRNWLFRRGSDQCRIDVDPRVCVNDALTIFRLIVNGAGIGVVSAYLCAPEFTRGALVHLLPDWDSPPVDVSLVYPSRRALSPAVRAFVDYLRRTAKPGESWLANDIGTPAAW